MNITAIAVIAVVGAILSIILKQYKPEYSILISLGTGVLIFIAVLSAVSPIMSTISVLADGAGVEESHLAILLKALSICYIVQLASDCCKDAGEAAAAAKLQTAGKVAILLVSLPLFELLAQTVTKLIKI